MSQVSIGVQTTNKYYNKLKPKTKNNNLKTYRE